MASTRRRSSYTESNFNSKYKTLCDVIDASVKELGRYNVNPTLSSAIAKARDNSSYIRSLGSRAAEWQKNPFLLISAGQMLGRTLGTLRNGEAKEPSGTAKNVASNLVTAFNQLYSLCLGTGYSLSHSDDQNEDVLEHYGRLGMKWGMHIFGEDKTYRKSMAKLGKADKAIKKRKQEADYNSTRGDAMRAKASSSWSNSRRKRADNKANKAYKRAYKRTKQSIRASKRADRIVKAMNKEFADKKISSFTDEDIMLGKKYCIDVLNRAMKERKLYEEDY